MPRKFSREKFQVVQADGIAENVRRNGRAETQGQAVVSSCGTASIIVGFSSLLIVPFILGPAAVLLGAVALGQGDGRGAWGIMLGLIGPVLAVIMGSVLFLFVLGSGLIFGL